MRRNLYTLIGIVIIALCAVVVNVSGMGAFTLNLWRPVTVHPGLDLQGGARVLLQAVPQAGQKLDDSTMEAARSIIESRVNGGFGVSEPVIQTVKSGNQRYISVELPGLTKNLQSVESVLQRTGQLTFVALGTTQLPPGASTKGYQVLAKGTDLDPKSVAVGADNVGRPTVDLTMRDPGAAAISNYSSSHVGQYMGIAVDNKIISSPTIQSALGSQFQITNVGDYNAANSLAITLKYGALPVPLKIAGVQEVSAALVPANVRASLLAGAPEVYDEEEEPENGEDA